MIQPSSTVATIAETTPTVASVTEGSTTAASVTVSSVTSQTQTLVCAYPHASWECVTDTWASTETWASYDGSGVTIV